MRQKLPRILLLSAWLFATGGVWDVVQVVAWARMFTLEVSSVSALEAAANTFSPEKKCRLCRQVERAKSAQDDTAGAASVMVGKAPIVFQAVARIVVSAPDSAPAWRNEPSAPCSRREVPPVPPPRVGEV